MTIGARLREERKRLGFTQPAFATIAGVKKNTQIQWEKNAGAPNAKALSALAEKGADVLYILTGRRETPLSTPAQSTYAAETALDEIENSMSGAGAFADELRHFALDGAVADRTRARADQMLARLGDEDAKKRMEDRDRRREDAFERAHRIVREAHFVVNWEPPDRLEAELVRLVVDYGVEARDIEELLRSVRDAKNP